MMIGSVAIVFTDKMFVFLNFFCCYTTTYQSSYGALVGNNRKTVFLWGAGIVIFAKDIMGFSFQIDLGLETEEMCCRFGIPVETHGRAPTSKTLYILVVRHVFHGVRYKTFFRVNNHFDL